MKTLPLKLTEKQHLALITAIESHLTKIYEQATNEADQDRQLLIKVRDKLIHLDFYAD